MRIEKPLALELAQALRLRAEEDRAHALRRLVEAVASAGIDRKNSSGQDELVAKYGVVYRELRERVATLPLTEVDIAIYAGANKRKHAICAFAITFDLPTELAENAVFGSDPGFLMLAARSKNFAWSTVRNLLSLGSFRMEDELFAHQCIEDYHMIASADARRFMSLVRLNLQHQQDENGLRTDHDSSAATPVRTNVR